MKLGSKTINAAVVIAVIGVIEQNSGLLTDLIGEQKTGIVLMVTAAIMAGLRAITTESIKDKYQKK